MSKLNYHKQYRSGLSTGKLFAAAASIFAVAIAVSATSTYAWYSISERFRIVGFEMNINYEDADDWFKLGKKESDGSISYQGEEPYSLSDLGVINPVVGNVSNMNVESYPSTYDASFKPTFSSGYRLGGTTRMTEDAKDPSLYPDEAEYVQFELYAYAKEDAFLYLTPETAAIANEEANRITAMTKDGVTLADLNNVVNAARMSFYTPLGYRIVELGEHEDVSYSGLLDLTGDGYFDVDASGREILYGNYTETPGYASTPLGQDEDTSVKHDIFHAAHQKGAYKWDENPATQNKKEEAYPVAHYVFDMDDPMNPYKVHYPVGVLKGGEVTRIVVSVFLEGWDHDMMSSLIDASFNLNLGFVAEFNPASSEYLPK